MKLFNFFVFTLYYAVCDCVKIRGYKRISKHEVISITTIPSTKYNVGTTTLAYETTKTVPVIIRVHNNLDTENKNINNNLNNIEEHGTQQQIHKGNPDNIYLSYNSEHMKHTNKMQKDKEENSLVQLYNNLGINNLLMQKSPSTVYRRKPTDMNAIKVRETNVGLDINFFQLTGHIASMFEKFKTNVKAIFPGTNWCGGGNQAKSENDIGFFYLTDFCCRAHDRCFSAIPAGEEAMNLKNNGLFTRSHCECDRVFLNCLKSTNSFVSNQIGYTYFNILGPQCFRYEYPIVGCAKRMKKKCVTYVIDETQSKKWQWFDNQIY